MEPVEVTVIGFTSSDGTALEADLLSPADPTGTAVVCHPHPSYGGTRQDAVVAALSRAFVDAGRRVLRFDFRGSGGSAGVHGGGPDEREDLLAAIEAVEPGDGPLTIAGYSFGADVALSVAHPDAAGWIVVAPPLAVFAVEELVAGPDARPIEIFAAAHDQFNGPELLTPTVEPWVATTVHVVDNTDHFFAGALSDLGTRVAGLLG